MIDLGLIGQYTEDGHVFLMRKREDGQSKLMIVKFIVVCKRVYNSIEELMNWMGNYGPDYLGFTYCCDGRWAAEDYDEILSLQIEKWKKTAMLATKLFNNTNSAIFQELEKAMSHDAAVTSRMVNPCRRY